ncbi:glycosyltransferase family 4 protein [Bacillota bacterium LX-D]|nr:glycosyltransferase family 4 protein [Bacillota bacterium LX-D]
MKIAMISTNLLRTPPVMYGGAEKVISLLTEELVKRGHEVTLFATGDSLTSAHLNYLYEKPDWSWEKETKFAQYAFANCKEFDLVHNNSYPGLEMAQFCPVPTVTTMHSLSAHYKKYRDNMYIAISSRQRFLFRELRKVRVIHHGLDVNQYPFSSDCDNYLVWVGRICWEKGVHHAVQGARKYGLPLKLIGPIADEDYFSQKIKPYLGGKIEYLGEMGESKNQIVKKAKCFLMPIEWEEPFGLVIIEAMACGTPVIAFNRGAVMELIDHGRTGFIVTCPEEMFQAVENIDQIDRLNCRQHVMKNFSIEKMASDHEKAYLDILKGKFR